MLHPTFPISHRNSFCQGASAFTRGLGAPLANAVLMNSLMFVGFREASLSHSVSLFSFAHACHRHSCFVTHAQVLSLFLFVTRGMFFPHISLDVLFLQARRWLPSGTLGTVLAATLSGVTTACISTPVDFIKIQAQLRGSNTRGLLRECGRTPRGLSLFATGHTMNMWREGVFTAIYLGLYTHIKDLMMKDQQAGASPPLGKYKNKKHIRHM